MRYVSTRGEAPPASLATALAQGLAPDGGLYLPERIDPLPPMVFDGLRGAPFADVAFAVARQQMGDDFDAATLRRIVEDALDFPVPFVPVDERTSLLELFHGPTLAFKDVGARVLARLLLHTHADPRPLTVLVATSGDTGSAVAHAFLGLPGCRVVVLYPKGQVSRIQEAQLATLGRNVEALAVEGAFDDCQRLAKEALRDAHVKRELALTSANSINIGRLLPQVWYYVYAALDVPHAERPLLVSVPSGNFGNLTAGLMARRLGAPIDLFVAATNVNDVVPSYLETGLYAPRPSIRTLSNAMDVGDPSNFHRLLHLCGGDWSALRREVAGSRHDDDETRAAIVSFRRKHGRVLDPHTAVGYLGLEDVRARRGIESAGIVVATAHPAKFQDLLEPLLGESIPLPASLRECLERPVLSRTMAPELGALKRALASLPPV